MSGTTSSEESSSNGQQNPIPNGEFPIVGFGASAGGLKTLKRFFEKMPAESGMAFVVILHLSPNHESQLAEILQRTTQMPVMQVNEMVKVEPNHVYVIPPTKYLAMIDGHIRLSDPERTTGQRVSIDLFFRTLADTHQKNAFCVVLSGTGADGSIGIKRVKEAGGIAIAQDPREAEYDPMPRNAINTGMVDFVLPIAQIPDKLMELWRNSQQIQLPVEAETPVIDESKEAENALRDVLTILRLRTGHDFMHYKRATILRRIERRMQVNTTADLPAYRDFLRETMEESQWLLKDLLIGVTNFFRDRDAFDVFECEVVPALFEGKVYGDVLRVWCAGCATGEEAYSVGMLLLEYAAQLANPPNIQIFATDIDEEAIQIARAGTYSEAIEADVTPARLQQFFTQEPGGYRINKPLREHILFAPHNLIKDPPFSKLDAVICRNLLIYLNRDVQGQVFELFHFALRPGGVAFLGSSESIDGAGDLFIPVSKKYRIFRAQTSLTRERTYPALPLNASSKRPSGSLTDTGTNEGAERNRISFGELHQQLVEEYAPPSLIVNARYEIVHLSENAGRFLRMAGGEPTHNLMKVVLPELRAELRTTLFQAMQTERSAQCSRVILDRDGRKVSVNMIVRPTREPKSGMTYALVLFIETEEALEEESKELSSDQSDIVLSELEEELQRLKNQLQVTIEHYETTVEELKSSNEEMQSINEELLSTTEELETSKEEFQSVNEELHTVNQELKNKVEQVSEINNDLKNLIASTDIATIFLDRSLRIRRFTPRASEIFNLIAADTGRPLDDITHKLNYPNLHTDAEEVIASLRNIEREVSSDEGRHYIARLLPYRTLQDRIDGVVLNFVDITERKRAEEAFRESEIRFRVAFERANVGIAQIALDGKLVLVNSSFCKIVGYSVQECKELTVKQLTHPDDNSAEERENRRLLSGESLDYVLEIRFIHKNGSIFWGTMSATIIRHEAGEPLYFLAIIEDISERKAVSDRVQKLNENLEKRVDERTTQLSEMNFTLQAEIEERRRSQEERNDLQRQLIAVQENERRRISRELHDQLGQQLTALLLRLTRLKAECEDQKQLYDQVEAMEVVTKQLDSDVDFLVWELRPTALDDLGLQIVLQNYAQSWSKHFRIPVEIQISGINKERLPSEIETTLYRIAQEALNNIAKHANSTQVGVLLDRRNDHVSLIIEDNGIGFDYESVLSGGLTGLGIAGMRERVTIVGGILLVETRPGEGTTIIVRLPHSVQKGG